MKHEALMEAVAMRVEVLRKVFEAGRLGGDIPVEGFPPSRRRLTGTRTRIGT